MADFNVNNKNSKLFIAGFPKGKSEEWFLELFSRFGKVVEIAVIKDESMDRFLGYGFIFMEDLTGAELAIGALNDTMIEGCFVTIRQAQF